VDEHHRDGGAEFARGGGGEHRAANRREYFIAKPFRKRLQKEGAVLDFGCCSFDFSKLPD
jgi:hypothetical protein